MPRGKSMATATSTLKVGDMAPDFTLPVGVGTGAGASTVTLSDFRGKKNVVVAFYPFAFTRV